MALPELMQKIHEIESICECPELVDHFDSESKAALDAVQVLSWPSYRRLLSARLARLRERQAAWLKASTPDTLHLDGFLGR